MSRRKRRAARAPRCRTCQALVVFFRSPFTANLRTFDPKPIDGHSSECAGAYPVWSGKAYRFKHLAEIVQVQRACSDVEAEAEVRDMPWYRLHGCDTHHDDQQEDRAWTS